MPDFLTSVKRQFRVSRMRGDNLPILVTPPRRDRGRQALAKVLADMGGVRGVEIGVRVGRSAIAWMDANPQMHLTCIDPWAGRRHEANFIAAAKNLETYNATLLRATSMEAVTRFEDNSLDFVHIDGNHEFDYCCQDIICWSRKLRPGGVMAVHDYLEFHRAGVVDAVRAYTHCHHIDPWFVTRDRLPTAFWQRP